MRINKHDTNGTKPLLSKGELGYDDYTAGGDTGRVYVGTGADNIALAKRLESNMMTKAQFNALAEERKASRAGSGFEEWGKHHSSISTLPNINEGIWTNPVSANNLFMGNVSSAFGTSKTNPAVSCINGVVSKLAYTNIYTNQAAISLPTAPTIYPYDTVLTPEQIASGVIKHADSSNSGLIVNGKFDTDTSGWSDQSGGVVTYENDGYLTLTNTGFNDFALQIISTIVGKKYIVEGVMVGTNATGVSIVANRTVFDADILGSFSFIGNTEMRGYFEFTALSTTTYIRLFSYGGATKVTKFDNIAVYPADAISRSDLVFLESWHEDISEKNFVYPLGNIQYLGGNTDGLTGITNGAFSGFETYSLFGNWQTPSALIGKGYIWSSLTEAQKKAFIANPENNCYLDGDKTIQVRYRVRVVQGLGDNWDYPIHNNIDGGGGSNPNSVSTYNPVSYIKPKGKLASITQDLANFSVNESGFFANKNYKTITTGYEIGMVTAINKAASALDAVVGHEGKCFALPIALVHR